MPQVAKGAATAFSGQPIISQKDALERMERVYQLTFQMFEKATAYENVILVAGYAGFFALWSAVAGEMPRSTTLWSVGLMGVSLVVYVAFHIAQMVTRAVFQFRMMAVVARKLNDPDFHDIWAEQMQKPQRANSIVLMAWPVVLFFSVPTGLVGGGLVAATSIQLALG